MLEEGAYQVERTVGWVMQKDGSVSVCCVWETGSDLQNVGSC